ncbi:hypothetical protein JOB18_018911 [Solea senegalensis]|uniref:Uncharacterized protein n=2 Tax=Solea senegalensis TaxID=28829 RepID=A0AAV6SLR2_SOLSE|nr:hypothetical protein JOB18_018911 [Solea senegalensis]
MASIAVRRGRKRKAEVEEEEKPYVKEEEDDDNRGHGEEAHDGQRVVIEHCKS